MLFFGAAWLSVSTATTVGGPVLSPMEAATVIVVADVGPSRIEYHTFPGRPSGPVQLNSVRVDEVIRGTVASEFDLRMAFMNAALPTGHAVLFLNPTVDGESWTIALPLPSMAAYYRVTSGVCGDVVAAGGPRGFAVSTFDNPHEHPTFFTPEESPGVAQQGPSGDELCSSAAWSEFLDSVRAGAGAVAPVVRPPLSTPERHQ